LPTDWSELTRHGVKMTGTGVTFTEIYNTRHFALIAYFFYLYTMKIFPYILPPGLLGQINELSELLERELTQTQGQKGKKQVFHLEAPSDKPLKVVIELEAGSAVSIFPSDLELSTFQAARVLGISRPTLIALLDKGLIPSRKVGKHRRVKAGDISLYKEKQQEAKEQQERALEEIIAYSQANGLYDIEPAPVKRLP
jgi:excisionase family DNA binding protein